MTIRTAVIGTGAMGRNHVRLYHDMSDSDLVAIADRDQVAAEAIARRHGVKFYTDYRAMLDAEKVDAVSICVPTTLHLEVASEVIGRGIHILVEKPIAASMEEGQAMWKGGSHGARETSQS